MSIRPTALALLALLMASPAAAVDFRISTDTIGQGYQLITSEGDILKRSRITQMLGLNGYDLLSDGTNSLQIVTQMRFDSDFGIADTETANIPQLKNNNFSLMYLYLEYRSRWIDVRAGRQLLVDQVDFTMMDGLKLTIHTGWYLGFEVVAGLEAKNSGALGVITDTQLEVDGAGSFDSEVDDELGIVLGAALVIEGARDHHGKFGYRRIMTPPISVPGVDGEKIYVDQERVFGNYHVRVIPELHLQAAWSYDIANGVLSDVQAGVRAPRLGGVFDIEAYYLHLTPTFEGSSIFNIFSTEALNDIDLRVRYHFSDTVSAYLGSYVRLFGNDKDADDDPGVADGITDVGIRAGARVNMRPWHVGFDATHQFGYGDLTTIDAFGGYSFLDETLDLNARITTLVFSDQVIERLEGVSFGGQLGIAYRIREMARFHLISEINTNRFERFQWRFYGLVDLDFWL